MYANRVASLLGLVGSGDEWPDTTLKHVCFLSFFPELRQIDKFIALCFEGK